MREASAPGTKVPGDAESDATGDVAVKPLHGEEHLWDPSQKKTKSKVEARNWGLWRVLKALESSETIEATPDQIRLRAFIFCISFDRNMLMASNR
ncbi:unnamed protein product [Ilex paraguariensis]|uniref:Uncharacterized protein n=1 Tax=Ilex paraguariensis TaxID=185542 RepID=A0ABC8U2Y1_9AQUA